MLERGRRRMKTGKTCRTAAWAALVGVAGLLAAGAAQAGPRVAKLFVAGDSTASVYQPNARNQQGWAAVLQPYFDTKKLEVVDLARGGRSSRTFITEGHW